MLAHFSYEADVTSLYLVSPLYRAPYREPERPNAAFALTLERAVSSNTHDVIVIHETVRDRGER